MTIHSPCFYEIRVEGQLTGSWSEWFEGMTLRGGDDGTTILSGELVDQAALLGVLNKIHALNLFLVSVVRERFEGHAPG